MNAEESTCETERKSESPKVRPVTPLSKDAARKITALLGSGNVSIQRGNVQTEAEQDEKRKKLLAYEF